MYITINGAPFYLEDYPVVRGFYGLILGNTFNRLVTANYNYNPATDDALFCFDHHDLGRVCTRATYRAHRTSDPATLATFVGDRVEPLLYVAESTRLAPGQTGTLKGRAPAGYFPGDIVQADQLIDDPRWALYSNGLLVHRCKQQVDQDGFLQIPVTNGNATPIVVGELTPFAYIEDVRAEAEFQAAEIVSNIHVGPDVMADKDIAAKLQALFHKHRFLVRSSLAGSYCHVARSLRLPHLGSGIRSPARQEMAVWRDPYP